MKPKKGVEKEKKKGKPSYSVITSSRYLFKMQAKVDIKHTKVRMLLSS